MSKTVNVVVAESTESPSTMNARGESIEGMVKAMRQKTLAVDADALVGDIERTYAVVADTLAKMASANPNVEIETLEFALGLDTNGKVSIFSSGASVSSSALMTFTLKPKVS
jgi:hypothetical protein